MHILSLFFVLFSASAYGGKQCVEIFAKPPYVRVTNVEVKEDPEMTMTIKGELVDLRELPSCIDHTLLKPEAKSGDIKKLVDEAIRFGFKAVCVHSCRVPLVKELLKQSDSKEKPLIATVIGFPLGANLTSIKVQEALEAYGKGVNELDMVLNIGYIKERSHKLAEKDIRKVVEATPLPVKVIIETGLLTKDEIILASKIAETAGAHFVKTSTGFSKGGARAEDIKLIKETISSNMKIKASGGIRDLHTAIDMIRAGADRLGLSSSVSLMEARPKPVAPFINPKKK